MPSTPSHPGKQDAPAGWPRRLSSQPAAVNHTGTASINIVIYAHKIILPEITMTAAAGALRRLWKTIALLTVCSNIDKTPLAQHRGGQTGRSGLCTARNTNLPKQALRAALSAFTPVLVDVVCPNGGWREQSAAAPRTAAHGTSKTPLPFSAPRRVLRGQKSSSSRTRQFTKNQRLKTAVPAFPKYHRNLIPLAAGRAVPGLDYCQALPAIDRLAVDADLPGRRQFEGFANGGKCLSSSISPGRIAPGLHHQFP